MHVLIIDDEKHNTDALQRIFTSYEGNDVTVANGVQEAKSVIQSGQCFDLILSDVMMGDGTGVDLHVWLRETQPDLAKKVIFLTGGVYHEPTKEYIDASGIEVIIKPKLDRIFELALMGTT